eukprot:Ihof_evm2s384 gene=Ihof_evmTU2s384
MSAQEIKAYSESIFLSRAILNLWPDPTLPQDSFSVVADLVRIYVLCRHVSLFVKGWAIRVRRQYDYFMEICVLVVVAVFEDAQIQTQTMLDNNMTTPDAPFMRHIQLALDVIGAILDRMRDQKAEPVTLSQNQWIIRTIIGAMTATCQQVKTLQHLKAFLEDYIQHMATPTPTDLTALIQLCRGLLKLVANSNIDVKLIQVVWRSLARLTSTYAPSLISGGFEVGSVLATLSSSIKDSVQRGLGLLNESQTDGSVPVNEALLEKQLKIARFFLTYLLNLAKQPTIGLGSHSRNVMADLLNTNGAIQSACRRYKLTSKLHTLLQQYAASLRPLQCLLLKRSECILGMMELLIGEGVKTTERTNEEEKNNENSQQRENNLAGLDEDGRGEMLIMIVQLLMDYSVLKAYLPISESATIAQPIPSLVEAVFILLPYNHIALLNGVTISLPMTKDVQCESDNGLVELVDYDFYEAIRLALCVFARMELSKNSLAEMERCLAIYVLHPYSLCRLLASDVWVALVEDMNMEIFLSHFNFLADMAPSLHEDLVHRCEVMLLLDRMLSARLRHDKSTLCLIRLVTDRCPSVLLANGQMWCSMTQSLTSFPEMVLQQILAYVEKVLDEVLTYRSPIIGTSDCPITVRDLAAVTQLARHCPDGFMRSANQWPRMAAVASQFVFSIGRSANNPIFIKESRIVGPWIDLSSALLPWMTSTQLYEVFSAYNEMSQYSTDTFHWLLCDALQALAKINVPEGPLKEHTLSMIQQLSQHLMDTKNWRLWNHALHSVVEFVRYTPHSTYASLQLYTSEILTAIKEVKHVLHIRKQPIGRRNEWAATMKPSLGPSLKQSISQDAETQIEMDEVLELLRRAVSNTRPVALDLSYKRE